MSLELKRVQKKVGQETHIYETDLSLEPGSFNVLLGTTLSGKTTLMRLMAGLEKPSEGEVWFKGENVTGQSVQNRSVSMVYQQFINYPNMSVFDNIASPLRLQKLGDGEIKKRVGELAELLKLSPMLNRLPKELSGGQQQRTAMARALAKNSELVLLDEPLANLDYKLREELREELPRLVAETGSTVVYATTEPSEALLLGGTTVAMDKGHVSQYGKAIEVYRQPGSLITAEVYSEPPINKAKVRKIGQFFILDDKTSWPVSGDFKKLPDDEYIMAIRPHHIHLHKKSEHHAKISGLVKIVEINGSESVLHFSVGELEWVSLVHGVHPVSVGASLELFMDIRHCFYFHQTGSNVLKAGN